MIELREKQDIILKFFREDKSQRAIARETGLNRRTVARYIEDYQQAQLKLLQSGVLTSTGRLDLIAEIVEKPRYAVANREKRKLTTEMIGKIKGYLEENEFKKLNKQRKQQKKIIDIHEALLMDGYNIGYSTVRSAVNALMNASKEAFIRLDYDPGDVCEFDWGDAYIYIGEKLQKFQMAVFTSAYGNYRYAILFPTQKTECFVEAHATFFEHIGGTYRTMVYDNMRVVVKKFVGLNEKEPTEALSKLSIYYQFAFRFCNIASGNEKGHVEKSVEYVRRKAFCETKPFESLEAANQHLSTMCQKLNNRPQIIAGNKSAVELMALEKEYLLPALPKYETARIAVSRVDKYSTVSVDTCHYSVPDCYVNKMIFTKVYSTHIRFFLEGELIAEHNRIFGKQKWSINMDHFLKTFIRKPGALAHSVALKQSEEGLQSIYKQYFRGKEKDFIELIIFNKGCSLDRIIQAIIKIEKASPNDVSVEKIKVVCQRKEFTQESIFTVNSSIVEKSQEQLRCYGALFPVSTEKFSEVGVIA